jgi:hypothetical protein
MRPVGGFFGSLLLAGRSARLRLQDESICLAQPIAQKERVYLQQNPAARSRCRMSDLPWWNATYFYFALTAIEPYGLTASPESPLLDD